MNKLRSLLEIFIIRSSRFLPRSWFWSMRAQGIDAAYGRETDDYATLKNIIESISAKKILDIGCGTGRLFPVYIETGATEIVGQDVSSWALKETARKFPQPECTFTNRPIEKLSYQLNHFDLCVSSRVLSAVPKSKLAQVLRSITRITKYIYLNEFGQSDAGQPSSYWFRHEYFPILDQICRYTIVKEGMIHRQTYYLVRIESLK